ncbi:TKL protein kinase [Phytophthora megakarya]|uniref:non-specific serine/threonine protein kinase n=1 Tax=Phytophthora megakarya TaxID=4795 RepID=A0A225X2H5_9STRA|nr:TKL protein kinase [Phytophthora megakarya]
MRVWALLSVGLHIAAAASSSGSGTSGTLNTLTTSCNGGCSNNGACVVVGQSSSNAINCVNDTNCVTLSSGQSALCLDAFSSSATEWIFQPAESNDTAGAGPFERVGLLQLDDHVTDLTFSKADTGEEPLTGALELASMNIQPDATLDKVTFVNLSLSGLDNALPLNSVKRMYVVEYINNCSLSEIPTSAIAGDSVTVIDLGGNAITAVDSAFQGDTFTNLTLLDLSSNALTDFDLVADNFPAITTLYLQGNALKTVPDVIFNLPTLQILNLADNPINASSLTTEQFTFLASLQMFTIDGITNTSACPTATVQTKFNESFTFCVGSNGDSSNSTVTEQPIATVPSQTEGDSSSSSSNKTNEQPKLTNSTIPSIAIGMGDLSDHPYMELGIPRSTNASSQTTSDFELLASVADGYIGLTRLSYDDVFMHKMLRVSSRSELWLGEYKHEAVLVKKIKSNTASKALLRDFVTEIELMFELKHPRIAAFPAFRGAMWDADGTELCAVVEYVDKGALRDCTVNSAIELSVPKQHAIARQISEAMAFLHKQNIIHGRLNAFNILLDKDYSAKLSLFSIFHYVKLSPLDNECKIFVAPELLRGEQPTERSDVYAFGVVLVEIDTGETPVMNARKLSMERSEMLSPTAKNTGFRLSRLCSGVMKDTIAACLENNPARRPTMADVAYAFQNGAMKL